MDIVVLIRVNRQESTSLELCLGSNFVLVIQRCRIFRREIDTSRDCKHIVNTPLNISHYSKCLQVQIRQNVVCPTVRVAGAKLQVKARTAFNVVEEFCGCHISGKTTCFVLTEIDVTTIRIEFYTRSKVQSIVCINTIRIQILTIFPLSPCSIIVLHKQARIVFTNLGLSTIIRNWHKSSCSLRESQISPCLIVFQRVIVIRTYRTILFHLKSPNIIRFVTCCCPNCRRLINQTKILILLNRQDQISSIENIIVALNDKISSACNILIKRHYFQLIYIDNRCRFNYLRRSKRAHQEKT